MEKFIETSFGQLKGMSAPDDEFCYTGAIVKNMGELSSGAGISIITKKGVIEKDTFEFIEQILADLETHVHAALLFLQRELKADPGLYHILEHELVYLDLPLKEFPVYGPDLNFYSGSREWNIRFEEGQLDICDPAGVIVSFKDWEPVEVWDISREEGLDFIAE